MYNKNKEQNIQYKKYHACTRVEATGLTELYNPNNEMYGTNLVQYTEKSPLMEEIFFWSLSTLSSSQILSRENLSSHSTRSDM